MASDQKVRHVDSFTGTLVPRGAVFNARNFFPFSSFFFVANFFSEGS